MATHHNQRFETVTGRKQRLLKAAEAAVKSRGVQPILFELDLTTAISIVGTIQFALRHPDFCKRATGKHMRGFVDRLIELLAQGDEGFRDFLKVGDDPAFDE
jgi:uncharacterized membrane protein